MLCRHCQTGVVCRPRGLCWSCYYTTGVRELYPSTSKYGRRGPGNFNGRPKPPTAPTGAPPGSPETIAVLAQRVQLRQDLWHPADATLESPLPQLARVG